MPNVLLLGFTVPDAIARNIFSSDSSPAVQTHKFAWSLSRSLRSGVGEVFFASACPIQNYPLGRIIYFRGSKFTEQDFDGVLLGFLNILILKQITRFVSCILVVPRLLRLHKIKWIFIHGVHSPFLLFGLLMRFFGKRVVVVLTDPPGVMLPTDGWLTRSLKCLDAWLLMRMLGRVDAIIALAPELATRLSPKKPALIFPGILDSTLVTQITNSYPLSEVVRPFTIVYAGGLNLAYGVDRLLDAVSALSEFPVRLVLFGLGDQEQRIRNLAEIDSRFIYGGFVGNDRLVPELLSADLLINPRPTQGAVAVMSFPSKLIEYLATGRPVLTTRIASIPSSYQSHFFYIEDESAQGIHNALLNLMVMDPVERTARALRAKIFIANEASEAAVGKKIGNLLRSISPLF